MVIAELKYFETGNSPRRVKNQSKSLNLFLLTAYIFQQYGIFVLQQLRTQKVDLSRLNNEYTN